jgi:FkbM family methyltransferase
MGYDVHRLPVPDLTLHDLEFDLPFLVTQRPATIIDVGANKGQTIELMKRALPNPAIISFEPNPKLAQLLEKTYASSGVQVEKSAVGSANGTVEFVITDNDELNSVLQLSRVVENPFAHIKTNARIRVPVTTLDQYCQQRSLEHIDLLKSDTQGYDLEVLKGSASLLAAKRVGVILVEVNFIKLYKNQCEFGQVERWLAALDYRLLGLYEIARTGRRVNWATACFIS